MQSATPKDDDSSIDGFDSDDMDEHKDSHRDEQSDDDCDDGYSYVQSACYKS